MSLECGDAVSVYQTLTDSFSEEGKVEDSSLEEVHLFGTFGFKGNNELKVKEGLNEALRLIVSDRSLMLETPLSWEIGQHR